jgi:hypothetical protein
MAKPITIAYTFQTQVGPIPLSQLDADIAACSGAINDCATYSNYLIDTSGAANTITVATAAGLTFAYSPGVPLQVKLAITNTSTVVNINVNGLGLQPVLTSDGSGPAIGSLVLGSILFLMYDGTVFRLVGSVPGSFASIVVGNPVGGIAGPGTINASGYFVNGFNPFPIIKTLPASVGRASVAVPANDGTLFYAIPAIGTYRIRAVIFVVAGSAGGFAANLNFSGTMGNSPVVYSSSLAGGVTRGFYISAAVGTVHIATSSADPNCGLIIDAMLYATGAGTVAFSWSQSASNVTATFVEAGSTMTIERFA